MTYPELEDISHLETPETFSEFAGTRNPNMNDYFGLMKADKLRKEELSSASRRNRAKQRVKRTPEESIQERKRLRQEKEDLRVAAKEEREAARAKAAAVIALERQRQDAVAEAGRALVTTLTEIDGTDAQKAKKAKDKFNKLFPTSTTSARAEKKTYYGLVKDYAS